MIYKDFGSTGVKVSALGFGAMRLPMTKINDKNYVDEDLAVPLIQRAFDLGVNYVDSAPYYCDGYSETAVGKALKGYRDRVYVSTKFPMLEGPKRIPNDFEEQFFKSLRKLDSEYVDFYHFWNLTYEEFENYVITKGGYYEKALKLKEQGLIRHICFSCHDSVENMKKIIGSGLFENMLCQYNLLDRANEESIHMAKEHNMGVVIMGPVAGGRLGAPSKVIQSMLPEKAQSTAAMALRFVLSNTDVTVALSGMGNLEMLEENVKVASIGESLSKEELRKIDAMLEENKRLADLYCTGCNYCIPCPKKVAIPHIFRAMNYKSVYGLDQYAKEEYKKLSDPENNIGTDASHCISCKICEKKCPQKIKISEKLKQCHNALA